MNALKNLLNALNSHITNAKAAVVWLTVARAALLIAAAISSIAVFTLWEQRTAVFRAVTTPNVNLSPADTSFTVAPDLQLRIRGLVDRHQSIVALTVFQTDLQFNKREIVFQYSDDPSVQTAWDTYTRERGNIYPIFNASDLNNAQMVAVINGEFACVKFEDTINAELVPSIGKYVPQLCRISLPPYYGQFSGYISVGLSKLLTPLEMIELRLEITKLSSDIFIRSIPRKSIIDTNSEALRVAG